MSFYQISKKTYITTFPANNIFKDGLIYLLNVSSFSNKQIESRTESIQIEGRRGAGRPKLTWKKLTERDCREWKLTTVDPQERSTWRSGVRSAMRAASQLPGKGPTDVDDAPAPAR